MGFWGWVVVGVLVFVAVVVVAMVMSNRGK